MSDTNYKNTNYEDRELELARGRLASTVEGSLDELGKDTFWLAWAERDQMPEEKWLEHMDDTVKKLCEELEAVGKSEEAEKLRNDWDECKKAEKNGLERETPKEGLSKAFVDANNAAGENSVTGQNLRRLKMSLGDATDNMQEFIKRGREYVENGGEIRTPSGRVMTVEDFDQMEKNLAENQRKYEEIMDDPNISQRDKLIISAQRQIALTNLNNQMVDLANNNPRFAGQPGVVESFEGSVAALDRAGDLIAYIGQRLEEEGVSFIEPQSQPALGGPLKFGL